MIAGSGTSELIRLNQVGYFTSLEKKFTVADSQALEFMVADITRYSCRRYLDIFSTVGACHNLSASRDGLSFLSKIH